MGLKKDRLKELAKDYYVQNFEATQEEVAELYSVSAKTISVWKKADDWEGARRDYHASPVKIKQLLQDELLSVAQGNPAKLQPDGISKLMAALNRCESKLDPTVVAKMLKELDNFISKVDPAFALECTAFHKQFLQYRISLES
ncbi:hypothetical protein ABDK00_016925 [Niabella insulamsoli]|uniref:hypothetical protein n=1 Tax=Niabella insulamsoli TaxID=3144874 RepID=UPI0031FBBF60